MLASEGDDCLSLTSKKHVAKKNISPVVAQAKLSVGGNCHLQQPRMVQNNDQEKYLTRLPGGLQQGTARVNMFHHFSKRNGARGNISDPANTDLFCSGLLQVRWIFQALQQKNTTVIRQFIKNNSFTMFHQTWPKNSKCFSPEMLKTS